MEKKTDQRREIRKKILKFSQRQEASKKIIARLLDLAEYKNAESIFLYLNKQGEVETDNLINDALREKKRVFAPITEDIMYLAEIRKGTKYKIGRFGIRQPISPKQKHVQPEIVIVPLVGFDKNKNRLGQGMGYYDRYFKDYKGIKVGLAFAVQEVEQVPTNDFDVSLDIIITEEKVF